MNLPWGPTVLAKNSENVCSVLLPVFPEASYSLVKGEQIPGHLMCDAEQE